MTSASAHPTSRAIFGILYAGFLLCCCVFLRPGYIQPDGAGYYSYLPTIFLDHDLNFWNEFKLTGVISPAGSLLPPITSRGYVYNHYPAGTAFLWYPFWMLGHGITLLMNGLGQNWTPNGFTFYYNFCVHFATALMGFCSLIFSYKLAGRYTDPKTGAPAVAAIALGTPFLWYCFINADMSHIAASFVNGLFFLLWHRRMEKGPDALTLLSLGFLGALSPVIRPQDGMILLFLILLWIYEFITKNLGVRDLAKEIFVIFLGALPMAGLQAWIWALLYGTPLGPVASHGLENPYHLFSGFHIWEIVFSSYHGLLFFAPVLAFSFWGVYRLVRAKVLMGWAMAILILGQILVLCTTRIFWEGLSFGMRMMVDWTPLLVVGMAACLEKRSAAAYRNLRITALLCAVWTQLLAWTYASGPLPRMNDYQTPFEILNSIADMFRGLPETLLSIFRPVAPASLLIPALLCLAPAGYFIVRACNRISVSAESDSSAFRKLPAIFLCLWVPFFLMTGLAIRNTADSRLRYAEEFSWLKTNNSRFLNRFYMDLVLREGIYRSRTGDLEGARRSFEEALRLAPDPSQILPVINKYPH